MAASHATRAVGVDLVHRAEATAIVRTPSNGRVVGCGVVTGVVAAVGAAQPPDAGTGGCEGIFPAGTGAWVIVGAARDFVLL